MVMNVSGAMNRLFDQVCWAEGVPAEQVSPSRFVWVFMWKTTSKSSCRMSAAHHRVLGGDAIRLND